VLFHCLNTNIYPYSETSGGQSYNLYLKIVHFFNTSVIETSMEDKDSCFSELVSNNMCCSIVDSVIVFENLCWPNA
jgi:hypothetical protein